MTKKTLRDVNLAGKRVVMRVDFNVPIKDGVIRDDTRIQGALPSINYILEQGANLVLMSHLGRPKGRGYEAEFSLKPVAEYLAELLKQPITFAPDCQKADSIVAAMGDGDIVMLENTRFYAQEQGKIKQAEGQSDGDFAAAKAEMAAEQRAMGRQLATYGDIYCNDAFGTAHRSHASTAIINEFMDICVAGLLMEKEIEYLGNAVENPKRPFVAILGGAKVSDKLAVVNNLLDKVDTLIIGGGMAYTFLKAMGHNVGGSLCELDQLEYALEMIAKAKSNGRRLLLPVDNIVADKFAPDANTQVVANEISEGWMGLDIGPKTTRLYSDVVKDARTVVWNGPMGCFEMPKFADGTFGVCQAVADADAVSIIGGGDSVSAVNKSGLAHKMSHISTGGGASLEYLEGKTLPGVAALDDK